ncbi:MAG TPA: tetratricopeptide repeat protein [Pirellulaceae bacterium]|jgi:tetratricopeptide (TPR) repeat protein
MATTSEALAAAIEHHQGGRLRNAEQLYREIIAIDPSAGDAWHLLGLVAYQEGNQVGAVQYIQRALQLNPNFAEAHYNLGNALFRLGELEASIASYRRALALGLSIATAHYYLGIALYRIGKKSDAATAFRRAIELKPDYAEAYSDLGTTFKDEAKFDDAVASYRRALELKPNYAEAESNLGVALHKRGDWDEAVAAFGRAIAINAGLAEAHYNLGLLLQEQGKLGEADASYCEAIRLQPELAEANYCHSTLKLLQGDFENGWPGFEWRWKTKQMPWREFSQPRWDGRSLGDRTILLHAEQGFGDTFHFFRYVALVKERNPAATVVVECQRRLERLLVRCPGIDRLIGEGDELPRFDVHCPLLSLPGIFNSNIETIPAEVPYLFTDPELVQEWRERLRTCVGFRVGVNWKGRSGHGEFQKRNIPLELIAQLAEIPGIVLVNLNRDEGREELAKASVPFVDLGANFDAVHGAYMDTTAVMMNLDLIITSDTSIPHLAGAIGSPVWLAVLHIPDWRWLLDRSDSPWYPTMRLFRQKSPGDWKGVFSEIKAALLEQLK